jgi:hypothetical protein
MSAGIRAVHGDPEGLAPAAVENQHCRDSFIHKVINNGARQPEFPFAARGMEQEATLRFNLRD